VAVREQRGRAEVQRLADELGVANRQLREYAGQVEELAAARERNRMAREIHDTLGHYLTAVNMQLEAARALLATDPEKAADGMSKALALTHEGLADVRRSVATL
jgi:signal transduction histidine kinase